MTKIVTVQSQQKWDHHFELRRTETSLLLVLNELGQQGWELVDVLYYKDMKGIMTWGAFLKRPGLMQAPPPSPPTATAAQATPAQATPAGQAVGKQPQGFDLSGDEFQLKVEEPTTATREPG